jgi:hypothetical protein
MAKIARRAPKGTFDYAKLVARLNGISLRAQGNATTTDMRLRLAIGYAERLVRLSRRARREMARAGADQLALRG